MRKLSPLFLVALIASAAPAFAGDVVEPSTKERFAEKAQVGGASYTCVGAGLRKVLFIQVYAAAFCVESAKADALVSQAAKGRHGGKSGEDLAEAIEDDEAFFTGLSDAAAGKLMILRMRRDVGAKKFADSMRDSLKGILPAAKIELLTKAIPGDAKKGQTVRIYSKADVLYIEMGGKTTSVADKDVAQKLWRVWLGEGSVTPSLKESIAKRVSGA